MKKKVLIMAKSLGGGGAEVAMLQLINRMPEEKYEITLALLDEDNEFKNRLKRNVKIIYIEFKSDLNKSLVSMYSIPAKILKKLRINKFFPFYEHMFKSVKTKFDDEYDLAIDFYGYGYFLTGYLAKCINAKKKATWLHDENLKGWFDSVIKYGNYYNKIFAVSASVKNNFIKYYPNFKDKCEIFYNVIDTKEIIKKSNYCDQRLFGDDYNILTVGRLHEQKGIDIAIKTAKVLRDKGMPFKWYVIGEGPEHKKLQKMILKLKLEDQFYLLGRKDNPYPYIKQCDLYVQPSRHEGYAITLVEARTLCKLILTSNIPSCKEQIQDRMNGYTENLDPVLFANKIQKIKNDCELNEKIKINLESNKPNFSEEIKKLEF